MKNCINWDQRNYSMKIECYKLIVKIKNNGINYDKMAIEYFYLPEYCLYYK